ncbi:hypothetical protein QYE76_049061 [Lolium multiflorum]|uniref:Uncharacterized protein n=1 Tax=Lolium multiflorum TaxID=4521 RepID=A0AAD8SNW1_LOLMU|nr:hypothetical protein QYE76_049061 [Lolium multiflorum]
MLSPTMLSSHRRETSRHQQLRRCRQRWALVHRVSRPQVGRDGHCLQIMVDSDDEYFFKNFIDTSSDEESDDDFVTEAALIIREHNVSQSSIFRGSLPGRKATLDRKRECGHDQLFYDYFYHKALFTPAMFRHRFRMSRPLFTALATPPVTPSNAYVPPHTLLYTTNAERKEAAHFVDNFLQRERQVDESLEQVKHLRKHWEDKIAEVQQEADRMKRDAVAPRKITFATPTEQQPLATPKDNMKKAAEILKKKDEEIDIDYVRTLVASLMKQQSKVDTSRRLESNPDHCMSTAQKDAYDNRHRDDESHTGSSERRRRTREHPNPIPVPSKTPPSDPKKGKDAMYSGKNKYRNPSPPPRGTRVLRSLAVVVQPETPDPMGQVESISATTWYLREIGAGSARRNPAVEQRS